MGLGLGLGLLVCWRRGAGQEERTLKRQPAFSSDGSTCSHLRCAEMHRGAPRCAEVRRRVGVLAPVGEGDGEVLCVALQAELLRQQGSERLLVPSTSPHRSSHVLARPAGQRADACPRKWPAWCGEKQSRVVGMSGS